MLLLTSEQRAMNDSMKYSMTVAAAVLLAASVVLGSGQLASADDKAADPAELEKPVKDFELKDAISSKTLKLSDHRGQIVVLAWYSPGCGVCPLYDERLKKFAASYADKKDRKKSKVLLLGIGSNSGDTVESLRDYAELQEFNFPLLRDDDGSLAGYFEVEQTNTFVIIDRKGVMQYRGAFDDSPSPDLVDQQYVKDAVEALLAGKKLEVRTSDTYG